MVPILPVLVRSVVMQLAQVPDLDMFEHPRDWDALAKAHPRAAFDLLMVRIDRAASDHLHGGYLAVPLGIEGRVSLPDLTKEPDYPEICQRLWERALKSDDPQYPYWVRLFQGTVLENTSFWLERIQQEVEAALSKERLHTLTGLIQFEGSLIIFRFPDLTRTFLKNARRLGGQKLYEEMRLNLYSGCGPRVREFTNGVLDKHFDYVEAEAAKAAEAHANDEELGPFYRWIVEIEQKNRLMNKMRGETAMATSN